jgi:hypothetical protein
VLARSDATVPEGSVLPELALTAPAPQPPESLPALPALKPLPVIDLAALELVPVAEPEQAFDGRQKGGIALAADKPVQAGAVSKRPHIAVPSA